MINIVYGSHMLLIDVIIKGNVIFFLNCIYLLTFLFSVCMCLYVCTVSVCVPVCLNMCVSSLQKSVLFFVTWTPGIN